MKKIINKLVLLLLILIPVNVFALTYTLDTPMDGATHGIKNIYIIVGLGQDEEVNKTGNLSCFTSDKDKVSCEIVPIVNFAKDGDKIKKEDGTNFKNEDKIGLVRLINKTYEEQTVTVTFQENSSTIKNVDNVIVGAADKPKSDDAFLKSLKISSGTLDPEFKTDVLQYVVYNFNDTLSTITFEYTCDNCSAKGSGGESVTNKNGSIKFGLPGGTKPTETDVKINVTSQDGNNTATYTIKVIKGSSTYNSNKLKSLTVTGYELSPKFDKDTKAYEVKVPKKVESIESLIKYETEDSNAKVKVEGAGNLDKDENEVKITVTNTKDETNEYTLKVIKEDETTSVIEIIGYKDKKVSFMNVDGVREELSEEEFAKKYPEEWEKIKNGTYQFDENGNIIKQKDDDNNNGKNNENSNGKKENKFPWIIVILIIVSLAIIGVAAFLIFRDPDKKKKGKDGKEEITDEEVKPEVITPIDEETPEITSEQEERLKQIDTYDEEARLEAENTEPVIPEEEEIVKEETIDDYVDEEKSATVDIDEALSDLMNTKEYNFKDKE